MKGVYTNTSVIDPVDLHRFDALYHQFNQAVYANILKLVQQPDVAEDILQESIYGAMGTPA